MTNATKMLFGVAGGLALLAVAYSLRNNATTSNGDSTARYVKAIYSLNLDLDPAQMNETAALTLSNLIYDGLLSFSPTMELQGAMAESWTTSQDGRTLTFKLRAGAKFHDGKPVTPQAVVWSLSRLMGPKSRVHSYFDCIEGADAFHRGTAKTVSGLRTVGQDQVEIRLREPFPPFLYVLAGATAKILPIAAGTPDGPVMGSVGSGPFRIENKRVVSGRNELVLRRFEQYYGERPKITELVLRELPEDAALAAAKDGSVHDLVSYPLSGKESVFDVESDKSAPIAATWIIGLNTRLPPFNDVRVRRAFKQSVDTERFRATFHPDAMPAYGYIPPGLPGFRRDSSDPASMVRLATAAAPSRKPIEIAIPDVLARNQEMKTFFETSLQAQGWNVKAVPMPWDQLMRGYSNKRLQAFLVSMNMDYPDTEFLVKNFESGNVDNFSGLSDQHVDALIRKARVTQDRVLRQKIYLELTEAIRSAAVTVDLFHPRAHYWLHRCVRGFEPNLLAEVYIDYRKVELDAECLRKAGS